MLQANRGSLGKELRRGRIGKFVDDAHTSGAGPGASFGCLAFDGLFFRGKSDDALTRIAAQAAPTAKAWQEMLVASTLKVMYPCEVL